jgi:sn-glycerol 3-phosphate transport system substrate-binding protein
MINTSSGFYGNVTKNAKFGYGLAKLPYYRMCRAHRKTR